MQNLTTGTGLPVERKTEKSQHLERLFHAVDTIKSDLTKCGKGLPESKRPLFESGTDYFSVRFKRKTVQKVEYRFDPEQRTLSRRVNRQKVETILDQVTDFYITFFPESRSVLYRIEMNGRENIRGYIFLVNMTK
jgi:hypothetical protein